MKKITVPSPISLVDVLNDKPMRFLNPETGIQEEKVLSFKEFMLTSVLNDDKHFGVNLDSIEICFRLRDKVKTTEPNQSFWLDDADYNLWLEALKKPSKGYAPAIVCQCLPFINAVKKAVSE